MWFKFLAFIFTLLINLIQSNKQGMPTLTKYIPLDVEQKDFDTALQSEWFMPDEYKNMDISQYLQDKCKTQEETARCATELEAYNERGMYPLLQYMIYLVDFMRENNIVWGVGRGSSVASYVLYLIGVHRINSIQFDLDWREFLR